MCRFMSFRLRRVWLGFGTETPSKAFSAVCSSTTMRSIVSATSLTLATSSRSSIGPSIPSSLHSRNAGKPADAVSVASVLRLDGSTLQEVGGTEYLAALAVAVPSAAHVRRYAEIVRERSVTRAIAVVCDEAGTLVRQPGEATQKLDTITTMFARLERKQLRNVPRDISALIVERIDHYTDLAEGAIEAGWPTRIPRLDAALMGGLRPGGLYILAARPSVGKSSLVEWIAIEMAKAGRPVLFLSLEMPSGEVVDRAVSNLGRVSYRSILTGKLDRDGRETVSGRASARASNCSASLPMWIDDQPALTLQDIRLKAKACKGVKVLILDYLQLCGSGRRDGNRNAEIEEISRGLKAHRQGAWHCCDRPVAAQP